MKMNTFKKLFLLTCCSVIALPALAQERHLTEAEINELFEQMFLKNELIVDTDEIELEDRQREEITEEILQHYVEDYTTKFKHLVIADDGTIGTPFQVKGNRYQVKRGYEEGNDILKNLTISYDIKNIDFMGQRAEVSINILLNYTIDMTDYKYDPSLKADALAKKVCDYHIKVDFDDMPRIEYADCTIKTLISNIEIFDESDYKEAARYLVDPPLRKAHYILDTYDQRDSNE